MFWNFAEGREMKREWLVRFYCGGNEFVTYGTGLKQKGYLMNDLNNAVESYDRFESSFILPPIVDLCSGWKDEMRHGDVRRITFDRDLLDVVFDFKCDGLDLMNYPVFRGPLPKGCRDQLVVRRSLNSSGFSLEQHLSLDHCFDGIALDERDEITMKYMDYAESIEPFLVFDSAQLELCFGDFEELEMMKLVSDVSIDRSSPS